MDGLCCCVMDALQTQLDPDFFLFGQPAQVCDRFFAQTVRTRRDGEGTDIRSFDKWIEALLQPL